METQIFHHAKIYLIFKKKSSQRNQNPSRYYQNSVTNLKFQHKPKISSFKNPHIKIDLLLLLRRGQNPLSYYILYNESKHNILALVLFLRVSSAKLGQRILAKPQHLQQIQHPYEKIDRSFKIHFKENILVAQLI